MPALDLHMYLVPMYLERVGYFVEWGYLHITPAFSSADLLLGN